MREIELRIDALCGLVMTSRGPSYTLLSLLHGMRADDVKLRLFAPLSRHTPAKIAIEAYYGGLGMDMIDRRLPFAPRSRFLPKLAPLLQRRAERRLVRAADPQSGRVVFSWGPVATSTLREVRDRGVPIIREKFNCAKAVARDILSQAYAEFDAAELLKLSDADIEKEEEELALATAVFSPSPMVAASLIEVGFDPQRIIPTSYGWEPARFADARPALPPIAGPTLMFAGLVCVRKGAAMLLQAWEQANITGRLVLVGAIEPLIAERFAAILSRDDVIHIPFTARIGDYFCSSDWMIFPSFEEGGPQVTYEAGGCGIPALVTPMGAGAFCRDGIEGIVLDSIDAKDWAALIRTLPDRRDDQLRMAADAGKRAADFTYDRVGAQRRDALRAQFGAQAEQALA
jgi:glycosyltransferase involved in cell wall biosynthesis